MTGTIDRIRDATIRANNVAELRAFYNRIGFGELLARGDDFVEGPEQLRPGMIGIQLTDPNGNFVEFVQPAHR